MSPADKGTDASNGKEGKPAFLVRGREIRDKDVRDTIRDAILDLLDTDEKDDPRGAREVQGRALGTHEAVSRNIGKRHPRFALRFPTDNPPESITSQFGRPDSRLLAYGVLATAARRAGPGLGMFEKDETAQAKKEPLLEKVARARGL